MNLPNRRYRHPGRWYTPLLLCLLSVALLRYPAPVCAEDTPIAGSDSKPPLEPRVYTTRAERRDAGGRHVLTPWLDIAMLLELEGSIEERRAPSGRRNDRMRAQGATVQIGVDLAAADTLTLELVAEADTDRRALYTDEALLVWAATDAVELEAGRGYTPFGEYYSRFVSAPLLEFAETRADIFSLTGKPVPTLDLALTLYQGPARQLSGRPDHHTDLAGAAQWRMPHGIAVGLSYQTDLADSDARLLEVSGAAHGDRYRDAVAGLSGFVTWAQGDLEFSLEDVVALHAFREREPEWDRPHAWNLEAAYRLGPQLEWALRLEGSSELEDAPERRYGAALTWRPYRQLGVTLEYLHGRYAQERTTDADDQEYGSADQWAAQASWMF